MCHRREQPSRVGHCHLEYLAVDSACQGRGYGKLLLQHVQKLADTVTLDCEPRLVRFYQACGFRCLPMTIYYRRHHLYVMEYGVRLSQREADQLRQWLSTNDWKAGSAAGPAVRPRRTAHRLCRMRRKPP